MTSLDQFLNSPAAQPLPTSAADAAADRAMAIAKTVASILGCPLSELIPIRQKPLDRPLFVRTSDAGPASLTETLLQVQPVAVSATGLTFRHQTDFSIRRLLVEFAAPPTGEPGREGTLSATVLGGRLEDDGTTLTTVRFLPVD